jgi:nucleoid DNA-binding protein
LQNPHNTRIISTIPLKRYVLCACFLAGRDLISEALTHGPDRIDTGKPKGWPPIGAERERLRKERGYENLMTIKKTQLIQMLADKTGQSKKDAGVYLESFVETITGLLKKGEKINITGLGIFKVADRKAREGRNPRTGETIQIPASKKLRFTPSKVMKEAVMNK